MRKSIFLLVIIVAIACASSATGAEAKYQKAVYRAAIDTQGLSTLVTFDFSKSTVGKSVSVKYAPQVNLVTRLNYNTVAKNDTYSMLIQHNFAR